MDVHQPHYNFSTPFQTPNNLNSPPPAAPPITPPTVPPATAAAAAADTDPADAPSPPAPADTTDSAATPPSPTPLLASNPATTPPSVAGGTCAASAAVEEASHVPALATPPDPATIPLDPPHGSPRPPPGQLLPDVVAAEEIVSVPAPSVFTPPPPGQLLHDVMAAEEIVSAPQTAAPSVFTPPPVTPTPPTDPEDMRPMDEDSPKLPEDMRLMDEDLPKLPEPSTEVLSATPQPGTDLTLSHVPLGATPHHIDEDTDVKMEEDVKPDVEQLPQMQPEVKQENGYSNGITPAATLELVSEQPVHPLNGSNGYVKSPSPSAALYPSSSFSALDHDDDGPPPAKRQKLEPSPPADLSLVSAPIGDFMSTVTSTSVWSRPVTSAQQKYALSTIRGLKKMKDGGPFIYPVDYIALGIPHYPTIVTHPMDLGTIEKKLGGGPKMEQANYPPYNTVDEFIADVRLVFRNCLSFNGPDHVITQMGKNVEEAFNKALKNMPGPEEIKAPKLIKKPGPVRRPSGAGGGPKREDSYSLNRPKREIPPPRDTAAILQPPKRRKYRSEAHAEQLKFCQSVLKELHKKQHYSIAYPFYAPVDIVALNIPQYPKIVKKPMDLSNMQDKLTRNVYSDAKQFHADFKLMIKNCFLFNPVGTPVHEAGVALNELFDEKWQELPSLHPQETDDDDEESDMDQDSTVMMMEAQIQSLHSALSALKKKPKKDKKNKAYGVPKPPKAPRPAASSSFNGAPKKKKKQSHDDDEVLTFEQKKALSESIQTLDGAKLEKVLEIIDEVYPEIRESSEEIELDIDSLPPHVLIKLYNFVIRPNKPRLGRPPNGTTAPGKNVVAGVKRKSMDEEAESERIRQLEATLHRLKNGIATEADQEMVAAVHANQNGDDSGSDSDSDSSSGSDSE